MLAFFTQACQAYNGFFHSRPAYKMNKTLNTKAGSMSTHTVKKGQTDQSDAAAAVATQADQNHTTVRCLQCFCSGYHATRLIHCLAAAAAWVMGFTKVPKQQWLLEKPSAQPHPLHAAGHINTRWASMYNTVHGSSVHKNTPSKETVTNCPVSCADEHPAAQSPDAPSHAA